MLKFINGPGGLPAEDFNGILISKVVPALDRVEHVMFPGVFINIPKGSRHTPLCGHGMGAGGKDLADHGHIRSVSDFKGRSEPGASGAQDQNIMTVHGEWRRR